MMTQTWRNHPKLQSRFHPEFPDDVEVLVHDGSPRLTDRSPEVVWVTVTGRDGNDIFTGRILNQPQQLTSVAQGAEIKFIAPSGEFLLMVTEKYLLERPNWNIQPCDQCGFDELFDAPSDLMRVIFPDIAAMEMFTSFCGVCGGVQVVLDKNAELEDQPTAQQEKKRWWQFWK
jgi:hypothetical protein